jgi:hypothetical protein
VQHLFQIYQGLGWRQHCTGNPGPAFINAVELAVAELALDIAARCHRQMDTSKMVMGFIIETGVIIEIHGLSFPVDGIWFEKIMIVSVRVSYP